jgi:LacI family transcriptional regulator
MAQNQQKNRQRVTQEDVAQAAGVTRSVVSYVLNGNSRSVAPETRDRILRAIDELGYRPNKFAQALMLGKGNPTAVRQIGIVINSANVFLRPYYAAILAGIHAKAHEEAYHIRFIRFFDELKDPLLFNGLIHDEEVCGLILIALDQSIATAEDSALIDQIRERVDNIVCVEWQREGLPSVSFNRRDAAYEATRHLLSLTHRRIAYIGESDERIIGFRQAMIESGSRDVSTLIIEAANDMRSGYDTAALVFPAHPELTAVVAGSDEVAIGLLRYLNLNGISVPSRIAITSIDNIEMAEFTNPPLTTINVQKAAMGRLAVQMVIDHGRTRSDGPVTVLLPCSLVVRESSGAERP